MDGEGVRRFFVRFRWIIIVVVLVALCASGVAFFLDSSNEKRLISEGDEIYAAMQYGDERLIQRLEKVSSDAKGIAASAAKFKLAAQYAKNKNVIVAKELYNEIASNKKLPRELQELAEYLGVVLLMGEGDQSEELEERLLRLASSRESIYRSSAKEALVMMKLEKKDIDSAVLIMKEIIGDPKTNEVVRKNIEGLFRVYGNHK
ncbi:MAG: hypothetical protein AB8U44_02380 [Aaplasma endosymbiont of Hyalomma asiaticum]